MALTLLRVSRPLRRRVASASRARSTSTCEGSCRTAFPTLGRRFSRTSTSRCALICCRPARLRSAARPPARPTPLTLPDKPSIAVLPFTNLSGDPEQEYFADGLVEDIITALSRVRSFFVIARNSSFTYKGRAVDVRHGLTRARRPLRARRQHQEGGRSTAHRRAAGRWHHQTPVWADRFEGDISDIFELQDKVTESVVGAVEPTIRLEEIRQARTKPTSSITAYDLYLRALPGFYSMTRDGFAAVRQLTNEALTIDPEFTLAKALGAYIRSISVSQQGRARRDPHGARSPRRSARRPDQPALRRAGPRLQRKDTTRRWSAIERSLFLNPNSAQGYTGSGWVNTHASRPQVAIDHSPQGHAPEPDRPGKGHRAVGHRDAT